MVEIIRTLRADPFPVGGAAVYGPLIHIHKVERMVHGNGIDIKVWGEMQIAGGEYVYARELKLNTLQVLLLTCEPPAWDGHGYIAQKRIVNKGAYDNYASIDVFNDVGVWQNAGVGPEGGSIWLNFVAEGE